LELAELELGLEALGQPRFHARQIFQWVHKRGVTDFSEMSDLARDLRAALALQFRIGTPDVARQERSSDGTTKFLLRLEDGQLIDRLATGPLMPNLAISLHATTEDQRDMLVPVNRKYGLKDLLDACRRFPIKRRDRITFEYVLLKDVNDTPEDARRLVKLLSGIRAKVNLLPLNEAAGIPFERPSDERVNRFAKVLAD